MKSSGERQTCAAGASIERYPSLRIYLFTSVGQSELKNSKYETSHETKSLIAGDA